ncbi:MAG: SulP family inorganic anion transporter [Acidimicrobiales bacterium]|nr:SulP family inorganic anion transporter [Acidimicrobiales bacterium]MYA83721.1 SulP family inorganic anion transporter [Acidimicrobiales bacterium]MYB83023.1 SulP family inorganic anion transporter [Acidimicrobiales bacterium]MYH74152.1 SulP family inorganic anion transporter [Acidimicrobiales bacterium]MYI12105.1 SulP family inorganic anion transporter [Acidimicrobiales bacterium]
MAALKTPTLNYTAEQLRGDVFGGLTAAVVMLPLSLAFGVASGLGAIAGLYGAVAVGLLTALGGGSTTQISGPTAPLSVAMSVVVVDYAQGDVRKALFIMVLAGALQILLGLLRLGSFVAYTPYPVVSGFTSAVGVIIIVVQLIPLLGHEVALGGVAASISALPDAISGVDTSAAALGILAIAVCLFWPRRLARILPPSVGALLVATVVSVLWIDDVDVIGEVPSGLPDLVMPSFDWADIGGALPSAVTLALLGSINSLLTARVADSMTRDSHQPNRELIGVGAANCLSAFIGAVPGAGATSATVANVKAGGRSRVSGTLCALVLGALVLGLGRFAEVIPHPVLAGILIKIGFDIIDWQYLVRVRRTQFDQYAVMGLTLGLSVVSDLLLAVGAGLLAAAMTASRQFERLELDNAVSTPLLDMTFLNQPDAADETGGPAIPSLDLDGPDPFTARTGLLSLRGTYTAASSIKLFNAINHDVEEHEVVIFDFTDTRYMDDSAAYMVGQLVDVAVESGARCIVMGLEGSQATSVRELNVLRSVPAENFVDDLDGARAVARRLLDGSDGEA